VTYFYGTNGTSRGRPVFIEDGTGERSLSYDALGNVTEEKRTIALPGFERVCIFLTRYHYDSWGRMLTMTYPDGEVVTYTYSYGGNLKTMYGDKGTAHYDYVTDITYNDFGQRSRIDYGNGTRAAYTYDVLHRLSLLRSVSSSGTMQIIKYTQDGVGNITEVYNGASAIGPLGRTYTNSHHYDALNRLTQSANSDNSYDILMEYSPSGRIAHKTATYSATYSANADLYYGYCDGNQPHAPKRVFNQNDNTLNELMWDIAGNLGQVNTAIDQIYNDTRFLFWTEDNRLHTVADNNWHSYYAYDHTGERTLKLTGKNSVIDVNADIMMTSSILDAVTLYPSPYVVLSNTGYTKHYYAGSDRLCARIGGGGIVELVQDDRLIDRAEMLFQNCLNESLNRQLSGDDPECIHSFEFESGSLRNPIEEAPSMLNTTAKVDLSDFLPEIEYYSTANNPEPDVYYYHADHLGSASWITDASGIPLQHLQYLPFGESFINQRATGSSYNERFTFTGKEKDSETGFYYFGARYYDPSLSGLFISVDPMADKYPSISPYAYCAWNPVKLVDPDGKDWIVIFDHNKKTVTIEANYIVRTGDEETKNSAINAINVWNDLTGKYGLKVGEEKYSVKFNLSVIGASDADLNNPDKNNNTYKLTSRFEDDNTYGETNINSITILDTKKGDYTVSSHEVGHTLGLLHLTDGMKGLMEEDGGRWSGHHEILKCNVMDVINYALHPEKRNPDLRSGVGTYREIGASSVNILNPRNLKLYKIK